MNKFIFLSKALFQKIDFELLEYLVDDNVSIEPKYYVPLLPIVLINGTQGIGNGFSTTIPCFNSKYGCVAG